MAGRQGTTAPPELIIRWCIEESSHFKDPNLLQLGAIWLVNRQCLPTASCLEGKFELCDGSPNQTNQRREEEREDEIERGEERRDEDEMRRGDEQEARAVTAKRYVYEGWHSPFLSSLFFRGRKEGDREGLHTLGIFGGITFLFI